MKRIPSWSAVAGALIVALSVMSLTPTSNAQPYGYYNGGGYGPRYEGYSAYGPGPYVYASPPGYYYSAYGPIGYQGYGAGPYGYGSPRVYTRNYRPYRPYDTRYDDPNYYPNGLRSYNEIYQSRLRF